MKAFKRGGFTIVELLATMAILCVIVTVIFGITQQTANAWRSTSAKVDAFQNARAAFESVTQSLSQATLNTYYDYYDSAGNRRLPENSATFEPAIYGRYSDLHFISGKSLVPDQIGQSVFFQTPAGYATGDYESMETLLSACGYYVKFDKDPSRPAFLEDTGFPNPPPDRYRYRLVQFLQPSQQLSVYASATGTDWFARPLTSGAPPIRQIADNVIALVLVPRLADKSQTPLASDYEYDSRAGSSNPQTRTQHQLPPLVEVVMVAIDETSAKRLERNSEKPDFGVDLGTFFLDASKLDDPNQGLPKLEAILNARRVGFRIFRTIVPLRNAKWSS